MSSQTLFCYTQLNQALFHHIWELFSTHHQIVDAYQQSDSMIIHTEFYSCRVQIDTVITLHVQIALKTTPKEARFNFCDETLPDTLATFISGIQC